MSGTTLKHQRYNNEQDKYQAFSYEAYSLVAETAINHIVTSVYNYRMH